MLNNSAHIPSRKGEQAEGETFLHEMIEGGKIEERADCQMFMGAEPWESGKNRLAAGRVDAP